VGNPKGKGKKQKNPDERDGYRRKKRRRIVISNNNKTIKNFE
jgi:hypothetical protein